MNVKNTLLDIYRKDGTKKLLASLISIIMGLIVGAIVVVIVGLNEENILPKEIYDRYYPHNEDHPDGDYHTAYYGQILNAYIIK